MASDVVPELATWMRQHEVDWICVVSPHLDDAAFSLATLLVQPDLPPRQVWTVFSATTVDGDIAYAKAMGFAGPLEEFEARRQEDREAMRLLGVPFRHLGAVASRFRDDASAAASIVASLGAAARTGHGKTLVLLPAGAGVEPSAVHRLWGKVARQPVGCRAHGEHEQVRDVLAAALTADPTYLVGYYAEVPYLWSEGAPRLERRLAAITCQRLRAFAVAPRVDFKLAVAKAYRSQVVAEFGDRPSFQRRSLSGAEWVYLPE